MEYLLDVRKLDTTKVHSTLYGMPFVLPFRALNTDVSYCIFKYRINIVDIHVFTARFKEKLPKRVQIMYK